MTREKVVYNAIVGRSAGVSPALRQRLPAGLTFVSCTREKVKRRAVFSRMRLTRPGICDYLVPTIDAVAFR